MKNTELKACIKASSAKGMKKPELFALLHFVLSPEPLERFAGYVRYLEGKFGTTDLIYRYTGGVGASVRFYIRSNSDVTKGATAISFDVKGETWVIPDDLPFADRTVTGEDLRARDNFNNLKNWLGQFTHAAGRLLEVEREIAKAREKSDGANDYSVDANRDTKKLTIKFNGGKVAVALVMDLNQRNQIAANVAQHAVITWPTKADSAGEDLAATHAAVADVDFAERTRAFQAEDKRISDESALYADEKGYTRPSDDVIASMNPFVRREPVQVLDAITNCTKANVPLVESIASQIWATVDAMGEREGFDPIMIFMNQKSPWITLFIVKRGLLAQFHLFFKDDVLVDYLVIPTRAQRQLDELFSPSNPSHTIGAAMVLFMLAVHCRDEHSYKVAAEWTSTQFDAGCKGFTLSYATSDEDESVIVLSPDYSQYEDKGVVPLSFTYDGKLKLIVDDLVEEPAPAAEEPALTTEERATEGRIFSLGDMGNRFQRPSGMDQTFQSLINAPMSLDEFKKALGGRCVSTDAYVKIQSAVAGRVGNNSPDLPVVLMVSAEFGVLDLFLVQNMQRGEKIISIRVDLQSNKLSEPVRPYGLAMGRQPQQPGIGGGMYGGQGAFGGYGGYGGNAMPQPVFKAEVEKFFGRPMDSKNMLSVINEYSLTPEHANNILDVIHRRSVGAAGYALAMDSVLDRAAVFALDQNGSTVQIATIGFVNGRFADIDRDSENLDALLRNRGDRPSRFTDRPAHVDSGLDMPQPDELHVREVADAPNPEPRVFPLDVATRIDFADRETAIDFLQFAAAGMPNWIVSQAVQFINLAAANIKLPSDVTHDAVTFRIVLNEALCVHVLDRSVDPMIVQATLRLPRK